MIKVLIVDDKQENLYLLQAMLDINGFKTIVAKNGAEALGLMRNDPPDLIISDILMPVMDGFTLCRECKKDDNFKKIPFVFYTATYTDPKDEEYALSLGADLFILKPHEPEDFIKTIENILIDIRKSNFKSKKVRLIPESVILKEYNEALIRKLEDKMVQTARAEEELKSYISRLEKEIIARKLAEEELQKSTNELHDYFENDISADYVVSVEGEIYSCNRTFLELFGFEERSHAEKFNITQLYKNPDDRRKMLLEVKEKGRVENYEVDFISRNGRVIHAMLNVIGKFNDSGELIQVRGYIVDITDRIHAEEMSRKLSVAVEQSPASIIITDTGGNIEYVNPKFCEITGYSNDEVKGKNPRFLKSDKTTQEEYKELWETITSGNEWFGELCNLKKDGKEYWEYASITSIKDKEGKITHFLAVKEDITDKKRKELELLRALEKAEESDRLKTAFLHNISHEIRTPLNAIIGFSGFLDQPDLTEEDRKNYIDIIFQSNNQLLSIVNDILNISYIEANQVKIKKSRSDLNRIMDSVYHQFLIEARTKNLSFDLNNEINPSDAFIETDESKLIQVISNLLNNAFKFTLEGKVVLGCRIEGDKLIAWVEDTGIGIPENEQARIFERFYQVDKSESRVYGGTGLGLSISMGFAELLGGEITVQSTAGKGSVFSLSIPYTRLEIEEPQEVHVLPGSDRKVKPAIKVLITEDEQSNMALILAMLKSTGYVLLRANDGKEAIDMCKSDTGINIVLMDIQMPKIDGFNATREILEFRPGLPIIAQTAFAHSTDRAKALECGCVDYISKPYSKLQLLSLIDRYI